jgi:hypothetical protein
MGILVVDGMKNIDENALKFCFSAEGDVYYYVLDEGKGLLFDLLSRSNCNLIPVDEDSLAALIANDKLQETHIFQEKSRGKRMALTVAIGAALLIGGAVTGAILYDKYGGNLKNPAKRIKRSIIGKLPRWMQILA